MTHSDHFTNLGFNLAGENASTDSVSVQGDGFGEGGYGTGDDSGHGGHDSTGLPTTPEEITAFVHTVRTTEDISVHGQGHELHGEHMQAMGLVPTSEATHIAIGNGSWFDPSNWHNGEVPGDDSMVVIPDGVHLDYDQESDARLFTVRVDGTLEFANDVDSKMVVDTMVVAPGGTLTAGTEAAPIADDVSVEIVIANNGPIDTEWDPALLSRGLISHGKTEIHGQIKDSHEKVVEDPMAGDTSVSFADIPEGWEVGDTIVIAGTHYEGYQYDKQTTERVYNEPEDEVRIITKIEDGEVFFDDPLVHDHDTPRADLKTSVANYSRSVTVKSEDGEDSEVYERGHVMMMHSDDVDIRYAAFEQLGRTDKSQDLHNDILDEPTPNSFDSNVAGRYGLHLHRTGLDDQNNPTYLEGNAVFGSPGWGIVHHDSHAVISNSATYDTFGAGFVAETGNETGSWTDNIAIDAQGVDWGGAKGIHAGKSLNIGISGDGFWFTGRMVDAADNVAASVNHGYIYFHRVTNQEGGKLPYEAELFDFAEALGYDDMAVVNETPILVFEDNEAFASRMGLHVIKSNPKQGHDIHSVLEDFTAWSVKDGVNLQYTSHYILKDFDLVAAVPEPSSSVNVDTGIGFGKNTFDITIIDGNIEGFDKGLDLKKGWAAVGADENTEHDYTVINTNLEDNEEAIFDLTNDDTILDTFNTNGQTPSLDLDGPLSFDGSEIKISGTKTDSLGTKEFVHDVEDYSISKSDVISLLEENGYYTTPNGDAYMVLNIYFSDRLTGDIFTQSELVSFDSSVPLGVDGKAYRDAQFNGTESLEDLKAMVKDSVTMVHDASEADARTIEDFADAATHGDDMDHSEHGSMMNTMHEGELMMATLNSDQNPLSEMLPGDHVDEETEHHEMAMI